MGTNCATLLADMRLVLYQSSWKQAKNAPSTIQLYIQVHTVDDALLSLNNSNFSEYLDGEHEIKQPTESATSASCFDSFLCMDNGKLSTRLYDKRDDFSSPIAEQHYSFGSSIRNLCFIVDPLCESLFLISRLCWQKEIVEDRWYRVILNLN